MNTVDYSIILGCLVLLVFLGWVMSQARRPRKYYSAMVVLGSVPVAVSGGVDLGMGTDKSVFVVYLAAKMRDVSFLEEMGDPEP